MPNRKHSPAAIPHRQQDTPAGDLTSLRRHLELCIEVAQIYGKVAAFDMKRIVRRWPDLSHISWDDPFDLLTVAVGRLIDLELAAAGNVPEQAPAAVTGHGGATPVPPQAPAPRPQPAPVEGVRAP